MDSDSGIDSSSLLSPPNREEITADDPPPPSQSPPAQQLLPQQQTVKSVVLERVKCSWLSILIVFILVTFSSLGEIFIPWTAKNIIKAMVKHEPLAAKVYFVVAAIVLTGSLFRGIAREILFRVAASISSPCGFGQDKKIIESLLTFYYYGAVKAGAAAFFSIVSMCSIQGTWAIISLIVILVIVLTEYGIPLYIMSRPQGHAICRIGSQVHKIRSWVRMKAGRLCGNDSADHQEASVNSVLTRGEIAAKTVGVVYGMAYMFGIISLLIVAVGLRWYFHVAQAADPSAAGDAPSPAGDAPSPAGYAPSPAGTPYYDDSDAPKVSQFLIFSGQLLCALNWIGGAYTSLKKDLAVLEENGHLDDAPIDV